MSPNFFIPICFFACISLSAQTVPKDSISWELDTDGNLITLRYKLSGVKETKPYLGVFVKAKGKAGVIPSRAQKAISAGCRQRRLQRKVITFDPIRNNLEDLGDLQFKFDVVAFPAKYADRGDELLAPVRQIPYLSAAAVGAGLGIWSAFVYADSRELYDVYKMELNPFDDIYLNQSREEYYTKANRKYATAQIMAVGGGALLVSGAALWIDYRMKKSGWNKMKKWSLGPSSLGMTLRLDIDKKR
ncbi:MAG: hypothetical protein IPJ00_22955 [Saprospirales bacterium]|nr:hypothetical protein [Saprospirales bacterium]